MLDAFRTVQVDLNPPAAPRLVKRDGAVFVALPDARTFSDRVYRKVAKSAGGHVNLFGSSAELETMLTW